MMCPGVLVINICFADKWLIMNTISIDLRQSPFVLHSGHSIPNNIAAWKTNTITQKLKLPKVWYLRLSASLVTKVFVTKH